MRIWFAAALAVLALPATASAVDTEGIGENVRHVLNVPHTEQQNASQTQQATDFELATIDGRTYAFAGSYYDGLDVVDVTDPEHAEVVASYDCGVGQGDVQVFRRDGRVYVAYAQDDGYSQFDSTCTREAAALGTTPTEADGGTYIVDVTDPLHPSLVSFVAIDAGSNALGGGLGSHNTTIHPSGRYLYNSNADLITDLLPSIEIVDIGDLRNPKVVAEYPLQTFPGIGTDAHDITFNADGTRAYVAALSHGEILDTTDPAAPKTISTIVDPTLNVWHQMETVTIGEREFLIAEDEFAGAEGTATCPSGAVHVYDVTDMATPIPVGVFQIDQAGIAPGNVPEDGYLARCTAHVFQIHREAQIMTLGWYNAGVRILDLSQLEGIQVGNTGTGGIKQLGWFRFDDADTWAVKAVEADRDGFYLFGNDKRRGFDVYEYTPGKNVSPGRWLTPLEALAQERRWKATGGRVSLSGLCLLAPSL